MQFSPLTVDFGGSTNRLYKRVLELKASRTDFIDLVGANVHDAGIDFPQDVLADIVVEAAALARHYRPDSLGQASARRALAEYADNIPERILLTPGTSISYWYTFSLLAGPGDEILCPRPSYPLFDYIARMSRVEIVPYRLDEARGWRIDLEHVEHQIGDRTRALVLISPHNPTGMVAQPSEVAALCTLARRNDIALIVDEVFREFTFGNVKPTRPAEGDAPLVFVLNGFSKMYALPGMKIGWISVSGDPELVASVMRTLEMISDTFLPVNEIAQFSVPAVLERGQPFLRNYKRRIESARDDALTALGDRPGVASPGGFYFVVPFDLPVEDEDLAIELLTEKHVLTHPGYFYDIDGRHLVVSFVGAPDRVMEGLGRIREHLADC
jgi:alanine-synthesizing transaminase